MRTKEQTIYVRKMKAWKKQQELSIADSKQRIDFFTKQEKIARGVVAINKLQLKLDTQTLNAEWKKFNKWLADNQ